MPTSKMLQFPPRWFHIRNYEGASRLQPLDWYKQLLVRQRCADIFNPMWKDTPAIHNFAAKALDVIRRDPLASHPEIDARIEDEFSDLTFEGLQRSVGVHSLTIRELYEHERGILGEFRDDYKAFAAQTPAEKIFYGTLEQEWMSDPVFRFSCRPQAVGLAEVDFRLPDSVLAKLFADWLRTTRALIRNTGKVNRYRKPEYDNWVQIGLLPCIDLLTWLMQDGKKISNRHLACAIHDGDPSKEDSIRMTARPLAEAFMNSFSPRSQGLLHRIRSDASYELWERKNARLKREARLRSEKKLR